MYIVVRKYRWFNIEYKDMYGVGLPSNLSIIHIYCVMCEHTSSDKLEGTVIDFDKRRLGVIGWSNLNIVSPAIFSTKEAALCVADTHNKNTLTDTSTDEEIRENLLTGAVSISTLVSPNLSIVYPVEDYLSDAVTAKLTGEDVEFEYASYLHKNLVSLREKFNRG